MRLKTGSLPIGALELSRWRLRRTRWLWRLNQGFRSVDVRRGWNRAIGLAWGSWRKGCLARVGSLRRVAAGGQEDFFDGWAHWS